ncbi:MAG: hypothetical protein U0325_20640 [Polyangiales bacterium]
MALAQRRTSAATRPAEAEPEPETRAPSSARARGRARNEATAEAPPAARPARAATRAPREADAERESTHARVQAQAERESANARIQAQAQAEREAEEQDGDEREASAAAAAPVIRGLASEGPRAASFVPRGWVLEQQAEGDLTGDRRPDLAVLIRQQRPDDAEHDRALVVVERGADGVYARIGVGTRFLLCSSCYGAVAGAVGTPLLSIRRGVLHVAQLSGSREARERALRFRLDAESGRMQLVGEELNTWDRVDRHGTRTVTNHLARTRVIERFTSDERRSRETRTTESHTGVDVGDRVNLEDCE